MEPPETWTPPKSHNFKLTVAAQRIVIPNRVTLLLARRFPVPGGIPVNAFFTLVVASAVSSGMVPMTLKRYAERPATWAAAEDPPERIAVAVGLPIQALSTFCPGAKRSITEP